MTSKIIPNVHAQWHPLKVIMVGKSFAPDYYEPIRDSRVRDNLQIIAKQTEEDYANFIRVIEQYGAKVIRTDPGYRNIEVDISNNIDFQCVPLTPMNPRNSAMVIGNKILITEKGCAAYENAIYQNIELQHIINPWSKHTNPDLGTWELDIYHQFHAPYVTRVGNRLFVDIKDYAWLPDYFIKNLPNYDIVTVDIGGHNDGSFSPIVPGKLLSVAGESHYARTFPGWEVMFIKGQWWQGLSQWDKLKNKNNGKWFIADDNGIDVNDRLIEFIDTWLNNWLGYVEETVFDVNCLVLDRHHICFSSYHKEVWDFCKKNNIEPILTPFRHRYFWDGGLHCITLDIVRDGDMFDFETCV